MRCDKRDVESGRRHSERDGLRNGTAEWRCAAAAAADRGTRLPRVHTRRGRHLRAQRPRGRWEGGRGVVVGRVEVRAGGASAGQGVPYI